MKSFFYKMFDLFGSYSPEKKVYDELKKRSLTLALAESITGGRISSKLVAMEGISKYFLGSFVVYHNSLKTDVLGVGKSVLTQRGVVSEETAESMLNALFSKTTCDLGLAVTGIAGPTGASDEKPVGLVYIAVGIRGKPPQTHKCNFSGNRGAIIEKAACSALKYLLDYLQ